MLWLLRALLLVAVLAALPLTPAADLPAADQAPPIPASRRVLGYYVPYDPTSWASFQEDPRVWAVLQRWREGRL